MKARWLDVLVVPAVSAGKQEKVMIFVVIVIAFADCCIII